MSLERICGVFGREQRIYRSVLVFTHFPVVLMRLHLSVINLLR